MKLVYHFFRLLGRDYYGDRIGILFAWELAKAFASHDDEFRMWDEL
jgi:hypothetical protein